MIEPHGGKLINRQVDPDERNDWIEYSHSLKTLVVNSRIKSDLELIATGAYSPLEGFMCRDDYLRVIKEMHLANGLPWSIPITLPLNTHDAQTLKSIEEVTLVNNKGKGLGILQIEDVFEYSKELEADLVYKTQDLAHPGVRSLFEQGDVLLGGKITYLAEPAQQDHFARYHLSPKETRQRFIDRGWLSVVAFQTRNPIHRAHEYIQKCALEMVDGLFIHPLVGETKGGDIPAEVRLSCYEVLLENYYPCTRTFLSVFPAAMRYAGPREAIFHAVVRKNYGATHFIVGRDHAGVGNYYGTYDAQKIFSEFDKAKIGITPLFFDYTFYCRRCGQMASDKTCNHQNGARVYLSGSKIRDLLRSGQMLPEEFTRPEISHILIEAYKYQEF